MAHYCPPICEISAFDLAFNGAAIVILCSSCEEVPSYVEKLRAGVFPWQGGRSGYWNGDGVPGRPKIVVYLSEQKSLFLQGQTCGRRIDCLHRQTWIFDASRPLSRYFER